MTETHEHQTPDTNTEDAPISNKEILKENWVLRNALIFFILMLAVPLILAWKLDWFLIAG
ncbi:MAG TPA: hypothetical protein VJ570_00545 [Holophagaceae bacterium]|nr:hypothetical protein [Holophagaceae bacterium]